MIFCLILAACAFALATLAAWLMSRAILAPPRMEDGKAVYLLKRLSPEDIGLKYESMTFDVRDDFSKRTLRIVAWWIPTPARSDRTVILLHGYADAKVGAIAWAPVWLGLGWNVLAIDLRAHGQSAAPFFTAGVYERHDVSQVIDELRLARPGDTRHVAIMGVSAGAAVAAAVGALHAEAGRNDIRAIVLDSPFVDYKQATRAHAKLIGLPTSLVKAAFWFAEWTATARFDDVRPLISVAKLTSPLLMIHSRSDPFVSDAGQAELDAAARAGLCPQERFVSWTADAEHGLALASCPEEYAERLRLFLAGKN